MSRIRPAILAGAIAATAGGFPSVAQAQELEPHSLRWPLWAYDRATNTAEVPRLGITNISGNFQGNDYNAHYLASEPETRQTYLHPGVDIRGLDKDVVRVAATANVWLSNADTDFCPHEGEDSNTQCRVYLLDAQKRYVYYYSHIDYARNRAEAGDIAREAIQNALQQQESYPAMNEPGEEDVALFTEVADRQGVRTKHGAFPITYRRVLK